MARKGNGTDQSIKTTSAITALTAAYSFAFWYKSPRVPAGGTSVSRHPFSMVGGASNEYDVNIAWDHVNTSAYQSLIHRESGGTLHLIQIPTGTQPAANTWHHLAGTFNGTTARVWLNGSNAASKVVGTLSADNPTVALMAYKGASSFDDGTVAEFALWSAALDTSEIGALSDGASPALVRPTSLVLFWPLIRDVVPYKGAPLTVTNNPSVEVHPRIYRAASSSHLRLTDNANYSITMSGGIVLGGAATVATDYTHTMAGGIVLGGSSPAGHFTPRAALVTGRRKETSRSPG